MVAQGSSVKSRISLSKQKSVSGDARALLNKKKITRPAIGKGGNAKQLMGIKVDARHKLMKRMDARQKLTKAGGDARQKLTKPAGGDARQKLTKPAEVDARQKLNKLKKVTTTAAAAKNGITKKVTVVNGKAVINGRTVKKPAKTSYNSGVITRTVSAPKSATKAITGNRRPTIPGNPNVFTVKNNRSPSSRGARRRRQPVRQPISLVGSGPTQSFPAGITDLSSSRMSYMSNNMPRYNPLPSLMEAPLQEMYTESLRLQTRLKLLQEEEERAQIHDMYRKELQETRALRQSINELEEKRRQREREMIFEEEIVYRPVQNTVRSEVFKPSYQSAPSSSSSLNTLVVSNLIPVVHESELESCFEQFGKILNIDFINNDSARITFDRDEDASLAEKYLDNKSVPQVFGNVYNGTKYATQRIKVRLQQQSGGRNDIKSYFSGRPQKRQFNEVSSGPLRFQSSNPRGQLGRSVERIAPDIQATHSALFSGRGPSFQGGRGGQQFGGGRLGGRRY